MGEEQQAPDVDVSKGESVQERIEVLEHMMHATKGFHAQSWGNMVERLKSLEQALLNDHFGRGSIETRVAALEKLLQPQLQPQVEKRSMKVSTPECDNRPPHRNLSPIHCAGLLAHRAPFGWCSEQNEVRAPTHGLT